MHHNHRDSGVKDPNRRNHRFPLGRIRRFRSLRNSDSHISMGGGCPSPKSHDTKLSISPKCYHHRRRKAAVALTLVWSSTITLHLISWGSWLILGLSGLLMIQALRIVFAAANGLNINPDPNPEELPFVSLLVAAKNEEAVIANLVKNLCSLNYPSHCYELWVIDDNSSDRTPVVLKELAQEYQQLKILHRDASATGGKSGALNQALPLTRGKILGIFDADAQVAPDMLQQVIPQFQCQKVGAVQLQKAIANASLNFWTRSQAAEMALDAFFQKQRVSIGGLGELRGNGEFIRRQALESCGGWCEDTITDDLDLTIRLHLDQWDIAFLDTCVVFEEGVTNWLALWHQRNRWAEGGYQRYLDYWKLIFSNLMGFGKTFDLFGFLIIQYILPMAAIPDLMMSVIIRRPPITSPLTLLAVNLSLVGMFIGLRRGIQTITNTQINGTNKPDCLETADPPKNFSPVSYMTTLFQTWRGTVYMFHWLIVVASATARMSVRPKRLKWVKTVHQGTLHQ